MKNFKEEQVNEKTQSYGYYSKVLNKPFDSLKELHEAEVAYYDEKKSKEDEKQKTTDALIAAFETMKKAEKVYVEAVKNYNAESKNYQDAFNEFVKKHPNGYNLTLEYDGDKTTLKKDVVTESSSKGIEGQYDYLMDMLRKILY